MGLSARKLYIESDGVKALVSPAKPKNAKGKKWTVKEGSKRCSHQRSELE
jgi:hypothetical protein